MKRILKLLWRGMKSKQSEVLLDETSSAELLKTTALVASIGSMHMSSPFSSRDTSHSQESIDEFNKVAEDIVQSSRLPSSGLRSRGSLATLN
jgi:hypothetical protein